MEQEKREKSRTIIRSYAAGTALVALEPVPLVDSLFIVPLQLAMVGHLARLHEVELSDAAKKALLATVGSTLVGNALFFTAASLIPGVKQIAGPIIAFGTTYTVGLIVNELFISKNLSPDKDGLRQLADKVKAEVEREKKEAAALFKKGRITDLIRDEYK